MTEQIFNTFRDLATEVQKGIQGDNLSIPIGHPKLGKYCNIRKRMLQLIFSTSGAGKSAFVDNSYILNPLDIQFKYNPKVKLKTILFSMERSKKYRIAKWIVYKIFLEHGVIIPIPKLLGWWKEKLTKDEHDLFLLYEDWINNILEEIDIYEGARSASDLYRILKEYFSKVGIYEDISEHKKIYIPNDENIIYNIIYDHGNLTKTTIKEPNKKQAIDLAVQYAQRFRDIEGANFIWVAQVNRDISNITRLKAEDAELTIEDVKASGDIGEACDVALSLFDPIKYKQGSKTGYNPIDFINTDTGDKYFRSITVCKSTYGADDVRVALGFNGFCGQFKELPRKKDLSDSQLKHLIESVKNQSYFLN